jgi:hypothetical protein
LEAQKKKKKKQTNTASIHKYEPRKEPIKLNTELDPSINPFK